MDHLFSLIDFVGNSEMVFEIDISSVHPVAYMAHPLHGLSVGSGKVSFDAAGVHH